MRFRCIKWSMAGLCEDQDMSALSFPSLDAAIAKAEGFGTPGAIPTLANNPGDLTAGPFATSHGATGSIPAAGGQQIATFPSVDAGTAAEDALIGGNYAGGSITDLAAGWLSGSSPQTQANWANTVAGSLGVPASTPVSATAIAPASKPSDAQFCSGAMWLNPYCLYAAAKNPSIILPGSGSSGGVGGFSFGRIAAALLGFIFIAGGIFMLKPTQTIISTARSVVP